MTREEKKIFKIFDELKEMGMDPDWDYCHYGDKPFEFDNIVYDSYLRVKKGILFYKLNNFVFVSDFKILDPWLKKKNIKKINWKQYDFLKWGL